jgi:hypothetical protein
MVIGMNSLVVLGAAGFTVCVSVFFAHNATWQVAVAVWIGIFIGYWCKDLIEEDRLAQQDLEQDADHPKEIR